MVRRVLLNIDRLRPESPRDFCDKTAHECRDIVRTENGHDDDWCPDCDGSRTLAMAEAYEAVALVIMWKDQP